MSAEVLQDEVEERGLTNALQVIEQKLARLNQHQRVYGITLGSSDATLLKECWTHIKTLLPKHLHSSLSENSTCPGCGGYLTNEGGTFVCDATGCRR